MYHYDNSKDLRTKILFGRLGKFDLLLTDSNVLADAISRHLHAHLAPSFLHSLPQREYVGICNICGSVAGRTVDRRVIADDKVWEYVDVTVRFLCVKYLYNLSRTVRFDRALDVGVPTDLKLYALAFQQILKRRVEELFSLVGSNPDGASLERLQISGVL